MIAPSKEFVSYLNLFFFNRFIATFTETPEWFIPSIAKLFLHRCKTPSPVPIVFEASPSAAFSNQKLLEQHGCSIKQLIQAYPGSCLSYGSEFRPIEALKPLLQMHPRWPKLSALLTHGSCWPASKLDEDTRKAKNEELVSRGNHKSATTYNDYLSTSLAKEIIQGWMIPLPIAFLPKLKHAEIAPVGVAQQWQAHDDGSRTIKYRMVHDQSFEASIGQSVNKRINKDALEPLFYGFCLSRTIHQIVALRAKYPNTRLLAAKTDFKAAYRRITLQGDTAARCTIIHNEYALPGLRLTFGGTPCAYEFCVASELGTDLAQDILHASDWDPRKIFSPHASKIPEPILLADEIPFGAAKDLDVDISANCNGCIDDFVDDGVVVVPDIGDNRLRGAGALPLAIHFQCRPLAEDEPVKRDDPLSLSKLSEEGTLAEQFILLGWKVDLRLLILSLPRDKFLAWSQDISDIIKAKHATFKCLDSVVGRLNHAAAALPLARYFLNRVRSAAHRDESNHVRQQTNKHVKWLSKSVIADLQLFSDFFLPKIHEGISLNLLTFRRPTHIFWSDACPSGMGGFSQHSGKAWRFEIPEKILHATKNQNNLLEFIASVISVWIEILDGAPSQSCFLSFADNTSAVGWLHKANVNEAVNKPLETATRHFASLLIQADCCLYSQHFRGSENKVADALSRRFDLTDNQLEFFIHSTLHYQVPDTFRLVHLPQSISSWVIWLLQKIKGTTASRKAQETRKQEYGKDGSNIAKSLRTTMTSTYNESPLPFEQQCLEHLPQPCDADNFLNLTRKNWEQAQSARPWPSWVRSLGQTWGTTPSMVPANPESLRAYLASSME
jgi:hypothetical protein